MSGGLRRGGIPGPESRTGLVRPAMTEAEFERRQQTQAVAATVAAAYEPPPPAPPSPEPEPAARVAVTATAVASVNAGTGGNGRSRAPRAKPAKPRRVQRMFAIEEELDKKLWLYAIHVGKDRSEVVNDLLRPLVASMVLYDSRDRRAARGAEPGADRTPDGEGDVAA